LPGQTPFLALEVNQGASQEREEQSGASFVDIEAPTFVKPTSTTVQLAGRKEPESQQRAWFHWRWWPWNWGRGEEH
jgi:hypothetical protein